MTFQNDCWLCLKFSVMSMESELVEKLWRSRNTILEVLSDRGYPIPEDVFLELEEFREWVGDDDEETVRDGMKMTYEKEGKPNPEKIVVVWLNSPKLRVADMKDIYSEMEENECTRAIIVVDECINPQTKSIIRHLKQENVYIDVYTLVESLINNMKHRYVPRQTICTPAEKKRVMNCYKVSKQQLPHTKSATDPVVRHLGAKKGQLIKVFRESETQTGQPAVYYRLVV